MMMMIIVLTMKECLLVSTRHKQDQLQLVFFSSSLSLHYNSAYACGENLLMLADATFEQLSAYQAKQMKMMTTLKICVSAEGTLRCEDLHYIYILHLNLNNTLHFYSLSFFQIPCRLLSISLVVHARMDKALCLLFCYGKSLDEYIFKSFEN